MIRERTRTAMSVKRGRGKRISGHAPFGWEFGRDGRLVRNAREQKVIAHVRRLRAKVLSYRGIATHLDREGVRPKRGRRWAHTTVKSMLTRNADWPGTDGGRYASVRRVAVLFPTAERGRVAGKGVGAGSTSDHRAPVDAQERAFP